MIDCFHGLRHNTVICRYYQDCNIRRVCSTHTHCGKCFMSRCIQESNGLAINIYSIRTNMLCNTSRFLIRYICFTDCIKKRCLTVIDMTHDADNRRSYCQILLCLILFLKEFLNDVYLFFLLTDNLIINCNIFCVLKGNLRVNRHNLPLQEQLLNNCGRLQLHLISQFLDGKGFGNGNHLDLFFHSLLYLLFRLDKAPCFVLILYSRLILFVNKVFP